MPTGVYPGATPTLELDASRSIDEPETPAPGFFPFEGALGYHFSVLLDYGERVLRVTEHVRYTNQSGGMLDSLPLIVEANRRAGVFHLIDAREIGGARIAQVDLGADRLDLSLKPPLSLGEEFDFSITYALNLPGATGPLGYFRRQINLGDWYPFVPAYEPEGGWLIRRPAAVGEHLAYARADYLVDIQVVNAPESYFLAGSAEAEPEGEGFRCRLAAGRDFAWSVSADYEVLRGSAGEAEVAIYFYPEHRIAGQASLEAVLGAMELFTASFGAYPRSQFAVVESSFPDGMEYDGLVFVGGEYFQSYGGGPDSYLTAISVHEASHQWWHAAVANDPAFEPWLDEALATYSELLFYERAYPEWVDWWWNFRVHSFEPAGWVDSSIYDHRTFRSYVDAVYLRGALFLRDLREEMGDPAFQTFLKAYFEQQQGKVANGADFFAALPEGLSVRLPRLMAPYFQRPINDYINNINLVK